MKYESRTINHRKKISVIHNSLFIILSRGFTLIELLIVVTILGVLAAGVVIAINPIGMINSANLAKAKTFSASVENDLAIYQVGRWSFDSASEPIKDTSGYENNGTWVGGVGQRDAATCGLGFGGCLIFDGSGYVQIPDSSSLSSTDAITIEAWIKPSDWGLGGYGHIVSKSSDVSVSSGYAFYLQSSGNTLKFYANGGGIQISAANAINLNQWQHVVVTYNRQKLKLYVNGVLTTTPVSESDILTEGNTSYLFLGARIQGSYNFAGLMDEVRIYSQALSFAQIQQRYAQGLIKHQLALK